MALTLLSQAPDKASSSSGVHRRLHLLVQTFWEEFMLCYFKEEPTVEGNLFAEALWKTAPVVAEEARRTCYNSGAPQGVGGLSQYTSNDSRWVCRLCICCCMQHAGSRSAVSHAAVPVDRGFESVTKDETVSNKLTN